MLAILLYFILFYVLPEQESDQGIIAATQPSSLLHDHDGVIICPPLPNPHPPLCEPKGSFRVIFLDNWMIGQKLQNLDRFRDFLNIIL